MKPHVRAAVAAIALSRSLSRKVASIYSYSDGGYLNIDAAVQGNHVNGYDYSNSCHIDGNLPNVYHYGESSFIDLRPNGNRYDGYDYGTSSFFEVTVHGTNAEVYDYGATGWFSFST
jgi:hypothetical protein